MFVKAYAKINVYLDVVGKRKDDYHLLDMVMLPLELHDTIEVEHVPFATETYIVTDKIEKEITKYDLIRRTFQNFSQKFNTKEQYNITVHKEIPICAGLGGGSSNAAAVLRAFEKYSKVKMEPQEELEFGLQLGADVPYCLRNEPSHVEGIGEKITPIKLANPWSVIIIKPKKGLSTKIVFEACDKNKLKHGNVNKVIEALETGNEELLSDGMFNSLEETSIKLVPEIQEIKDMLKKDGFKCVLMTGSGSCVFALTKDHAFAYNKFLKYERKGYEVILTKTLKQK